MKLKVMLFITMFSSYKLFAQCTLSTPSGTTSAVVCTGCTNTYTTAGSPYTIDVNTTANTWCVASGQTVTFTGVTWRKGTLNVCGTAIITTLTPSTWESDNSNPAFIYVGSGGSLTVSSIASQLYSYQGISNRGGTLIFSGNVTLGNNNSWIVTANSASSTTFNGTFQVVASNNFVNRGTTTFNGATTISSNNAFCLEKSYSVFNSSFTNSATNGVIYGGSGTSVDAVMNYSSTATLNNNLSNSIYVKICRNGVGATDLSGSGFFGSAVYSGNSCLSPLPVILTSFYAQKGEIGTDLIWSTSQEFNNDHFEIERSHDGINFEKITNVNGQGTKNSLTTYVYNDIDVNRTLVVYYRIKQVDYDGKFEYSNVIVLNGAEGNSSIEIYPNPLDEGSTLYARFGNNDEGLAKVSLFDLSGKLINEYFLDNIQPNGIYAVEDKNLLLVDGSYILQIKTLQNVYNQKLEVK